MKTVKVLLKGLVMTCALTFRLTASLWAQSESNNPVTYDSTITEQANGEGPYTWNVRITRQQNDPSQRPAIFFIPGSGEIGSNPAELTVYGPHYWLANGWNGGVKLGNGTHYPIIISIEQPAANMRPWHLKAVLETLLKIFPIKRTSVHVAGLSEGSYEWGELISYAASKGDETTMSEIKSWVDLEGVGPGDNFSGYNQAYPQVFGTWATQFGGRFFGLEGTQDSRNIWQITQAMNAARANSGYFCYENIGGGAHCCWNSMFDPSVTNWSCTTPVKNANLVPSKNPASTMGDYFYSASTGSNVFQWMLRQGDTSMVSSVQAAPPTVSAGTSKTVVLPATATTLTGSAVAANGTSITAVKWTKTSGPSSTTTITSPNSSSTTVANLAQGTYAFTFSAQNNMGQTSSSSVNVVVQASAAIPPQVKVGGPLTITLPASSASLTSTATSQNGATLVSVLWTKVSGPNNPTIVSPTSSNTTVTGLVAGTYVFQLAAKDNNGNNGGAQETVIVNSAQNVPTVNAGAAQTITLPANSVNLAATASAYGGASLVAGLWSKLSGPNNPVFSSPTNSYTTSVSGLVAGTYVFQLMAQDNNGLKGYGQVTVTVNAAAASAAPTVAMGAAQTITLPTSSATISGNSTAHNGASLVSIAWSEVSGPNTASIAKPGSTPTTVSGLVAGTYVFRLTAKDNNGNTGSGQVSVTVNGSSSAQAPTVTMGAAQVVTLPTSSATISGNSTAHNGASLVSIAWSEVSGPNTASIAKPGSTPTTVSGLVAGTYVFRLTAKDNNGNTGSGQVTVTVNGSSTATAQAPSVIVSSAQTVTLPTSSVTVSGTSTTHNGASLMAILWTEVSGPNNATISSPGSSTTSISGLVAGTYVFQLTATDNGNNKGGAQVIVTVNAASGGTAPAGTAPITVATGEYQAFFINQSGKLYAVGTNLRTLGVNMTGTPGTALPVDIPSNLTIKVAASGLHGGAAADNNGNVWTWGDNTQGQTGNGTVTSNETDVPTQVTTDATGKAFTGVIALAGFYSGNVSQGWYAIKSDGSLWAWGQTIGGMSGDGTTGQSAQTRPKQVPIPGNRRVVQVATGDHTIILCNDGTVWSFGGPSNPQDLGYAASSTSVLSPVQLTGLSNITQIAGGGSFNYAVTSSGKVYGWGYYGEYLGGSGSDPVPTPIDLTSRLNLPAPVKQIAVSMTTSYAILTNGTLWAWGDNAQGGIGNGQELNYATTNPPYTWDWNAADLLVQKPVQVTSRNDWAGVFAVYPFVMYVYAETSSGQLYSWGRNKSSVLGNGVVACNPDIEAAYPNSWDVTTPTAVNPLGLTSTRVVASPYCVSHASTSPCNECALADAMNAAALNGSASGLTASGIPEQFLVYPTMTTGLLNMRIVNDTNGTVLVSIYDLNGRAVLKDELNKENTILEKSYNVGGLSSGMYILQAIIGNEKRMVTKFIKQ